MFWKNIEDGITVAVFAICVWYLDLEGLSILKFAVLYIAVALFISLSMYAIEQCIQGYKNSN